MTSSSLTWLVTGSSRGLGRAIVEALLDREHNVIATLRHPADLDDLAADHPNSLLCLEHDVRNEARASEVVQTGTARFGQIDVLVNNAGYGLVGSVEELSDEQIRCQMETNFLGAVWTTKAVIPGMRETGKGEIVQVSTTGAVGTMPFFSLYNASKWALEGFSEALAGEVAGFGIGVTIAEPGSLATDWAGSSMVFAGNDPAYDGQRLSLFGQERLPWDLEAPDPGAGDPVKAAATLIDHVGRDPAARPLRLLVGQDAPAQVSAALALRRDDYARNPGFEWPG